MRDRLLHAIQNDFPMTQRPFRHIAHSIGSDETTVLSMLRSLKDEGVVRQISAIFDTRRLGYDSSLVAFRVPSEEIERAAERINSHPGVSHNYERDHSFNLWFTLAVAPDSRLGLEGTVDRLREMTRARSSVILPTIRMFKISVKLDTAGTEKKKEKLRPRTYKTLKMKARHFAAVRELQKDLPLIEEPFAPALSRLGMSAQELFDLARELLDAGVMRRFAAILNHRKAGFGANAMSVWNVPEDRAIELGNRLAEYRAVSHCYLRPRYPQWPYNLFAMVHAKSKDECDALIDEMALETGIVDFAKLYSTREFKKRRILYFDPAFEAWERRYASETFLR